MCFLYNLVACLICWLFSRLCACVVVCWCGWFVWLFGCALCSCMCACLIDCSFVGVCSFVCSVVCLFVGRCACLFGVAFVRL